MTWRTVVVALDELAALVAAIRARGGTVTRSNPTAGGVAVTWTAPYPT
jgi:hypothetical protein